MPNPYQVQIQSACGCDANEAVRVESIMRDFVLHSTLDWLSTIQFRAAARKAHCLYRAQKNMFDDYFAALKAQFQMERQTRD